MKKWPWFILSLMLIILDQATKYWASKALIPYDALPMMPSVNFTLAFNKGAAFSFLSSSGQWARWFFPAFSLFISGLLVVWIVKTPEKNKLQLAAFTAILGGALGNFYDRAFNGYVIDFIDVYYGKYHWPIFNVADIAICVGAFLLILDLVVMNREKG